MSELVFLVKEDPDGGFIARALGPSIFTQGESKAELVRNIRAAVRCHFDHKRDRPKRLLIRKH